MKTRIVLVDDQVAVRTGFGVLVGLADDLEVVGEAANGRDGVALVRSLHPDVVLMDIRMPVMDGVEATRQITADPDLSEVRVIALTTFEVDEYVLGALGAGAAGFLLKDIDAEELHSAIRSVVAGHSLIAPAVTGRVIDELVRRRGPAPIAPERLDVLTTREREVVRAAAGGLSNEEIAEALFISPLTAKTHVSRAMIKLGVRDRTQLVILAFETGLAEIGDRHSR